MSICPDYWHRILNGIQVLLLLSVLLTITAVVGYLLFGFWGALFAFLASLFSLLLQPIKGTNWMLHLYDASPIKGQIGIIVNELASQVSVVAHLPVSPRIYFIASPLVNAFSMGDRKDPVIVVTEGLLRNLTRLELKAIFAHEIGHILHHDLRVMTMADYASRLTSLMSIFGLIVLMIMLPSIILGHLKYDYWSLFLLVFSPQLALVVQMGLSRSREYAADEKAIQLMGEAKSLISALSKIEKINISWRHFLMPGWGNPEPSWLRTHPSTSKRIVRLKKYDVYQKKGGADHSLPWGEKDYLTTDLQKKKPRWHWWGLWH